MSPTVELYTIQWLTCSCTVKIVTETCKTAGVYTRPDISHFIMFDVCNQVLGLLLAPTLIIIADNVTTAWTRAWTPSTTNMVRQKLPEETFIKNIFLRSYPLWIDHNYWHQYYGIIMFHGINRIQYSSSRFQEIMHSLWGLATS